MAWIIGLVSDEELKTLRKIGWEDEDAPSEMLLAMPKDKGFQMRAFFVDSNVFTIIKHHAL